MDKHLHIICLNVPYPVDYGGMFDLFYKLPALQQQGVKIYLHCFEYNRGEQPALNQFCEQVYYYKRKTGFFALHPKIPYIVSGRRSDALLHRLLQDSYPILMEGVHCTWILNDKRFAHRKCFVRLHNIEHIYYRNQFSSTSNLFKKLYFLRESVLLEQYEKQIGPKAVFLTVSEKDAAAYKELGAKKVEYLPLFLPFSAVKVREGMGNFCLYQGDLSVPENEKAVRWLVRLVFKNLSIPFVIAGKNPSSGLKKLVARNTAMCLIENPNEEEMQDLIAKAHITIIPSYNNTGIKLKLLNALFNSRHCVVNKATVDGTGLEDTCHIAATAKEFQSIISKLYSEPFTGEEIQLRQQLLNNIFNNETNVRNLISLIWPTIPLMVNRSNELSEAGI